MEKHNFLHEFKLYSSVNDFHFKLYVFIGIINQQNLKLSSFSIEKLVQNNLNHFLLFGILKLVLCDNKCVFNNKFMSNIFRELP